MNAAHPEIPTIFAVAGDPCQGGIFAGRFYLGIQGFALISAPAEGELIRTEWSGKRKKVAGALSYCDGLANTRAMAGADSELGQWATDLRIGDFDDWYIPSRLEALIQFGELGDKNVFAPTWYWTSTQYAGDASYAWFQYFGHGGQGYDDKSNELRARAVRRVPIESFINSVGA